MSTCGHTAQTFRLSCSTCLIVCLWGLGFERKDNIEKLHLRFCKNTLKVRNSTPNFMVYGELGRFPLKFIVEQKMIMFWNSLLIDKSKLSSMLYKVMFISHIENNTKFKWISYIKDILDNCGLSFMWKDQIPINRDLLKNLIKQKLRDQYIQLWFSQVNSCSRGEFYSIFKEEFKLESYLLRLSIPERMYITKLRCSNLKFPIETGRWSGVPREKRICHLCKNGLGDEFHYLFLCSFNAIEKLRALYIPSYYSNNPREYKLKGLLSLSATPSYRKNYHYSWRK